MLTRIISFLLCFQTSAFAAKDNTVTLSSHVADKATTSVISLQPSFKDVFFTTDIDLSFDASKSRNQVNYNTKVDDFIVEKTTTSAGLDFLWNKSIGLGIEGNSEIVDKNQVASTGLTTKLKFKYEDFLLSLSESNLDVKQTDDFYILNVDKKDLLKMKKKQDSLTFIYSGFDLLTVSLNYVKYKYESDNDLPTVIALLTTKNQLTKNGPSFLSQIYTLTDYETHLDLVYSVNDQFDFEIAFGESFDYYDPYLRSNDLRLGTTMYFEPYNIGLGATAVKPEDSDDYLYSADISLSYNF